ncbi:ArsB/NhaD family transporter [Agreia sp. PsM10]|nr:SLC13 family permease [Agreia sp. PsM10]MDN4640601.1 ArsB/NhaD family transporter [Agreia sp. PsM10]
MRRRARRCPCGPPCQQLSHRITFIEQHPTAAPDPASPAEPPSRRGLVVVVSLLAASFVVIATGILPWRDTLVLADRVVPVLGFVAAITIVTELAAEAGVFTALAGRLARWGRGRRILLWLFVLALAVVSTIFLSLDTTAVLVTPVVVLLALHAGLPPLPFALATVWLANTASLLLPVSNLTNLLAEGRMDVGGPAGFAALVAAPAAVGIVVPVIVLSLMFRKELRGRYSAPAVEKAPDRTLLLVSAIVVAALLPLLVSGLPVWIPATVAAVVIVVLFGIRRPGALSLRLVPWQPLGIAVGLFVLVETAHARGLTAFISNIGGSGTDLLSLLQLSALGTVSSNAINNLPAYLVLEPIGHSPVRLAALLIGVNLGPLITPWASLATLLWHQKITGLGVTLSWPKFMLAGLGVVLLTVPLATVALWLVAGQR